MVHKLAIVAVIGLSASAVCMGAAAAIGGREFGSGFDGISLFDMATKKVTQTLAANASGANRLKFTPDGRLVLVSTLGGADLIVLSAATRAEIKRIVVGRGAAGIEMQPDGRRAFVACTPDDYVAVIDLASLTVAGHIDAGRQPDGLAWAAGR